MQYSDCSSLCCAALRCEAVRASHIGFSELLEEATSVVEGGVLYAHWRSLGQQAVHSLKLTTPERKEGRQEGRKEGERKKNNKQGREKGQKGQKGNKKDRKIGREGKRRTRGEIIMLSLCKCDIS